MKDVMNIRMKFLFVSGMLILSLFLMGCSGGKNYDGFAQCITGSGVVMFGSETCPHCQNVKNDFGNSFRYIEYVECGSYATEEEAARCQEAGVKYLPHFEFGDGSSLFGELPFDIISEKTGCALP